MKPVVARSPVLAISCSIAHANLTQLQVESQPDESTVFSLTFPTGNTADDT